MSPLRLWDSIHAFLGFLIICAALIVIKAIDGVYGLLDRKEQ